MTAILMHTRRLAMTPLAIVGVTAPLALAWGLSVGGALAQEAPVEIPPPAVDASHEGETATAVFAGGCFWGVQGVFQHVNAVESAVSGYAGGTAEAATYDQTSTGTTGHAEAVQVTYDPDVVSYGDLLQIFFSVAHNPTQLNYQGPDHGTQYRSALFPTTDEQAQVARAYIAQLDASGVFGAPIVTTIEDLPAFYPAEAYHQDFLARNPTYPYIAINDLPKIEALKALFPAEFRTEPVLVGRS
jgi:peptide-methionine (S)-S-oxide reductase